MHARCVLPEISFGCQEDQVETVCSENTCCFKKVSQESKKSCKKPGKKQCGDQKGCDPATCCICCFALIVEPAKFVKTSFIEQNKPLPGYSNNFISTYISTSWNPPEMVWSSQNSTQRVG